MIMYVSLLLASVVDVHDIYVYVILYGRSHSHRMILSNTFGFCVFFPQEDDSRVKWRDSRTKSRPNILSLHQVSIVCSASALQYSHNLYPPSSVTFLSRRNQSLLRMTLPESLEKTGYCTEQNWSFGRTLICWSSVRFLKACKRDTMD